MTAAQIQLIRPCLLLYDIPKRAGIANPSDALWQVGIRLQWSAWVIPEGDIPYNLMGEMMRQGEANRLVNPRAKLFRWNHAPFDATNAHNLLDMARQSMETEIGDAIREAQESLTNAETDLNAAVAEGLITPRERATRLKKFRATRNLIVNKKRKRVEAFRAITARFGVDVTRELDLASAAIDAIQTGMDQRAREYARITEELAARLGEANPLVRAARKSKLPGKVLADAADESGVDAMALRLAFGDDW